MPDKVHANLLEELRKIDTPTICNAMESVAPERRGYGYTTKPLFCLRPDLGPMVGYARTATIRSEVPHGHSPEEIRQRLVEYYTYVERGGPLPSIIVVQDMGESVGKGSFWGEVFTNVHKGLGAVGALTNGSIRDLPDAAEGFQMLAGMVLPSHAWVNVREWGVGVTVHGMEVADGDLIHADQHGAIVIPHDAAAALPAAVKLGARRERIMISAAKEPGFSVEIFARKWEEMAAVRPVDAGPDTTG